MFAVKRIHHRLLVEPHELAVRHCCSRSHAESLACQRAFSKKIPLTQYADRCFLAGLGYNGEPHFAILNIEDGICHIALGEYSLLFRNSHGFPALANGRKESAGVEIAAFPDRSSRTHVFLILVPKNSFPSIKPWFHHPPMLLFVPVPK